MTVMIENEAAALKAAKKYLQKEESGALKLKELAKTVVSDLFDKKVNDDDNDDKTTKKQTKQVRAWIEQSSKFEVHKKMVSLKSKDKNRKRTISPQSPAEELKQASTSSSKKSKKNNSGNTQKDMDQWRVDNKIVLLDYTQQDEQGQLLSKQHNENPDFYPWTSFHQASAAATCIDAALIRQCTGAGNKFVKPSPIQSQAWPILTSTQSDVNGTRSSSSGRDIVGIAETGSGKTLAFALPALSAMAREDRSNTSTSSGTRRNNNSRRLPRMLVLSPTRELAMQSDVVLQEFGAVVQLSSLVIYGGVPKFTQTNELKRGNVDCIVATPGRLKDLIQQGSCDLSQISQLVLDEADRMLDMGFEEDVRYIITQCKSSKNGRQTAMFSATWPAAIQNIAMEYMVNPIRVYVGFDSMVVNESASDADGSDSGGGGGDGKDNSGMVIMDDSLSANKRVQQNVQVLDDAQRPGRLTELLHRVHGKRNNRVLIFALYKKEAERLEYTLKKNGWNCCSIHGNKAQQARTAALAQFRDGTCPLLVATDVAARGLDIPNVEVVINYTFPLTIEDYIHRIGRTGRAGNSGVSYTFFQPSDKARAGELQQVMRQAGQDVPEELLKFGSTIKKKEHKMYGNFGPRGGNNMKQASKITFESDDEAE